MVGSARVGRVIHIFHGGAFPFNVGIPTILQIQHPMRMAGRPWLEYLLNYFSGEVELAFITLRSEETFFDSVTRFFADSTSTQRRVGSLILSETVILAFSFLCRTISNQLPGHVLVSDRSDGCSSWKKL